jgi:hypothetical protein
MYICESGDQIGRMRRELGVWACVIILRNNKTKEEVFLKNECGAFPLPEEMRMAEKTGSVGCSCGLTINMGNFESVRVDSWLTLPCTEETVEDVYGRCRAFVATKIEQESSKHIEKRDNA